MENYFTYPNFCRICKFKQFWEFRVEQNFLKKRWLQNRNFLVWSTFLSIFWTSGKDPSILGLSRRKWVLLARNCEPCKLLKIARNKPYLRLSKIWWFWSCCRKKKTLIKSFKQPIRQKEVKFFRLYWYDFVAS